MASVTVEVADVVSRYLEGDLLSEFTSAQVQTQITDAVDWADSRWLGAINARLASGKLTANLYKRTISDAVLRVMRNPGGLASEGELGYNYTTRAAVASGNLWFTADDLATLTGLSALALPSTIGVSLDRGWG
jgi:hypothetical protein